MSNETMAATAIGFPWFEPEDYGALRHLFSDGDRLPFRFEEWDVNARKALDLFRDQGALVVQVRIEPSQFNAWCTARGIRADYRARQQFASEIARSHAGRSRSI